MPRGVYPRSSRVVQVPPEAKLNIPPALARACGQCAVFAPEDRLTGDCKLNPAPVRKYATDWCGQFTSKTA